MKEPSQTENQTKIIYDKLEIFKSLNKTGIYEDETSIIKKWEDDEVISNMFILQRKGPLPFLGVVNGMFQREGYCVNNYANGDSYFGYFSEDERNKHGIYSYNPSIKDNQKLSEFYFGLWLNNKKHDHGIYLWLTENKNQKPFSDFDNSSFQAYVGNVDQDVFTKGTLMTKEGNNYYVYHGTFSRSGKKEGDLCFYFCAEKEMLLYGSFRDGNFVSGHVACFTNDGIFLNICKFSNGKIIPEEEVNQNELNEVKNIMFNFRNVIMTKDYFGEVYNEFKDVINFREKFMSNIDILNSDKYIDIVNATIGYNTVSIFRDIERFVES